MATNAYNFKHADGTSLGPVYSMENNGPGAQSVPLQIIDVDYSTNPIELILRGDLTERFPAAQINRATIVSSDGTVTPHTITISGTYNYDMKTSAGNTVIVFDVDGVVAPAEYTILATALSGANTVLSVEGNIPPTGFVASSRVSNTRRVEVFSDTDSNQYYVSEAGSHPDVDGNTRIPLHSSIPLATPSFEIVSTSAGSGGSFVIEDAANGCCLFRPGSSFTVSGNAFAAANATYVVANASTSGSYVIVGAAANSITIAGDARKFFVSNHKISVSGGTTRDLRLTVASAMLQGGNTVITTTEAVPEVVATAHTVVCVPTVTDVVVAGLVPLGTGAGGRAAPALPAAYAMSAPPAITPTTPHNFLVTWRISGDHASMFSAGCPVLIKGNSFYEYQEFPIQSVSVSAGMTHVVTHVTEPTGITPSPDSSGMLVYPAPAAPVGYMQYTTNLAFSSLKILGKGSPTYNDSTTWGQAIQDNALHMLENFAAGIKTPTSSIVPGTDGKFHIGLEHAGNSQLVAGNWMGYFGDTGDVDQSFLISAVEVGTNDITVTVSGTVPATFAGDGNFVMYADPPTAAMVGQLWYDRGLPQLFAVTGPDASNDSHGVVIQTVPANEYVDMGNNKITMLADASLPQDAVNVRTADLLYISKTGGYNATPATRSGTMTGSLNIGALPVGKPDVLGLNVSSAPVRMYGTTDVEFDAASTGNIHIAGSGNILVDVGNVTVGTTTNKAVLQNNLAAAPTLTFTTDTTDNAAINLGSNKIVNLSTPTQPLDATNKAYVDGLANGIVWLQPVLDPNLFSDALSTPPFVSGAVTAVTTGASNTFTVAGNFASSLVAGQVIYLTDNALPTANKGYVIVSATDVSTNTDIQVAASSIAVGTTVSGTLSDTSVPMHKTFIVSGTGTDEWVGLDNHVVSYGVTSIDPVTQVQTWGWIDILGRAIQVGDRFAVFAEPDSEDPLTVLPAGGLVGSSGKIATVATISPVTFSFYTPTEPFAFSVTGTSPVLNTAAVADRSPHFGHSYTFRGTWGTGTYGVNYKWIEFAGPSMLAAGGGLKYAGNVLNVGAGPGIIVNADTVQLDKQYANGIYLRLDGTYPMTGNLQAGGFKVTNLATPTVNSDAANKIYVDDQDAMRVAKTGDSMSGSLTFTSGTVTGITNPINNSDAATKVYTDNQAATRISRLGDTMTGNLVMSGVGVGITLPNDPVVGTDATNKTYVDTMVPLAGGTMTGLLVLSADPAVALGAATKQYVDTTTVSKGTSTVLSNNVNITFGGIGEVLGLPAVPTTAGSAASKAYVDSVASLQAVDTNTVHLNDVQTITGAKTFTAVTTINNQVSIAADGVANNLLITPTNITLTGTPVSSGGAANITATAGSNSSGTGGNVAVNGGNGSTSGGSITLVGGQGSAGTGGNVTITTGTGTTANGQMTLTAGLGSIGIAPTGVISVGGAVPTAKSQALVSSTTTPGTMTQTWQLVGTRVASAPANSAAAGVIGNWFADDSFFYVYGATGWRRIAITTF